MKLIDIKIKIQKETKEYEDSFNRNKKMNEIVENIEQLKDIRKLLNNNIELKIKNNHFNSIQCVINHMDELEEKYEEIFKDELEYEFNEIADLISSYIVMEIICSDSANLIEIKNKSSGIEWNDTHYIFKDGMYKNILHNDVAKYLEHAITRLIMERIEEYNDKYTKLYNEKESEKGEE